MHGKRMLGRAVPAAAMVLAVQCLAAGVAGATPEADTMLLTTTMVTGSPMDAVPPGTLTLSYPGVVGYSFSGGITSGCLQQVQVPPAEPVTVPVSFAEAPSGERGHCTSLAGSGDFTYGACMTGVATGSASLKEPNGETVSISTYTIAFFSGVGVAVASPAHGGGYTDDNGTGTVAGPALLVPLGEDECVFSDTTFSLTMALVGEHPA